jgi:hypothetical protein
MQEMRERKLRKSWFYQGRAALQAQGLRLPICSNSAQRAPANTKIVALFLYISGLSLRRIAKATCAGPHTVYRWILEYDRANYEKPEPQGEAVVVELDEMALFALKKDEFGFGRLIVAIPINLSTGSAEGETMIHFKDFTNGANDGM